MKSDIVGFSNAAGYWNRCKTCDNVWAYLGKSTCICDDAPVTHVKPTKKGETWAERCKREEVYNR